MEKYETYFAVKDPDQAEIRFVRYLPGSRQTEHRGKAPGDKRVSDHLQHVGMAADKESASLAFYGQQQGFHEFLRGGPTPGDIRWINLKMPGTPGDIVELMVMASAPAPTRQHICFEVPGIQRAYKQLLANGQPDRFKPFPGQNPVNRWIMFIRDPNGIRIEFMGEAVTRKKRSKDALIRALLGFAAAKIYAEFSLPGAPGIKLASEPLL